MALRLGDIAPDFTAPTRPAPAATSTSCCASSTPSNSPDRHSVATPVNWTHGQDVIIVPSLSDADAKTKFPGGWKTVKPYLRIVPQPR